MKLIHEQNIIVTNKIQLGIPIKAVFVFTYL